LPFIYSLKSGILKISWENGFPRRRMSANRGKDVKKFRKTPTASRPPDYRITQRMQPGCFSSHPVGFDTLSRFGRPVSLTGRPPGNRPGSPRKRIEKESRGAVYFCLSKAYNGTVSKISFSVFGTVPRAPFFFMHRMEHPSAAFWPFNGRSAAEPSSRAGESCPAQPAGEKRETFRNRVFFYGNGFKTEGKTR